LWYCWRLGEFAVIHRADDIEAFPYLKQKRISQGVAETEYKVFFGMLRYSLENTVLHPDGMLRNTVVVNP